MPAGKAETLPRFWAFRAGRFETMLAGRASTVWKSSFAPCVLPLMLRRHSRGLQIPSLPCAFGSYRSSNEARKTREALSVTFHSGFYKERAHIAADPYSARICATCRLVKTVDQVLETGLAVRSLVLVDDALGDGDVQLARSDVRARREPSPCRRPQRPRGS